MYNWQKTILYCLFEVYSVNIVDLNYDAEIRINSVENIAPLHNIY